MRQPSTQVIAFNDIDHGGTRDLHACQAGQKRGGLPMSPDGEDDDRVLALAAEIAQQLPQVSAAANAEQ
jgi:hypothetical protein